MKLLHSFKLLILTIFATAATLSADTLLDNQNFNVTLNLSPSHYLTTSDLDFKINSSWPIDEELPIESTTGRVVAYSNSPAGHYVIIAACDYEYLSEDGYSFVMKGASNENPFVIPFILNSSFNPDGSPALNGVRHIYPGDIIIDVDGSFEHHKVIRDLWGSLIYNSDVYDAPPDFYKAVLTMIHFSNENP